MHVSGSQQLGIAQSASTTSNYSVTYLCGLDLSANPACPRRPQRPTVAYIPPPGDCRATDLCPTPGNTGSSFDRVSTHAIRHADDWLGTIHDLQAHGPTTVPLPGSPRCARCGLAPQRTGSVESVTASDIALKRTGTPSGPLGEDSRGLLVFSAISDGTQS